MKLRHIVILFVLCFTNNLIFSQDNLSGEKILWNKDIKLKWKDFQGEVPSEDLVFKKAATCYEIMIESNSFDGAPPNFMVTKYFIKNRSWTVTNSIGVLAHEQLHFDIAELFARKMRKRFLELQQQNENNSETYIKEYYKFRDEEALTQEKYDSEVLFNSLKQKEWIDCIAKELDELKDFEFIR